MSKALNSNQEILNWVCLASRTHEIDLSGELKKRREELATRQFYISDE